MSLRKRNILGSTVPKELETERLYAALNAFAKCFEADLSAQQADKKLPTILMVSKFDRCLMDILYRVQAEALPLVLLPAIKDNKPQQEVKLDEIIETTGAELVMLARYMQVLSDEFSSRHLGKIINIPHSFLPAYLQRGHAL